MGPNSYVYDCHIESCMATFFRDHLAATRDSVGVYWHPYSSYYSSQVCTSLKPISMGSAIPYSIWAYNKFPVPSGTFRLSIGYSMFIVPGKYGTDTKHGSSNSISFRTTLYKL